MAGIIVPSTIPYCLRFQIPSRSSVALPPTVVIPRFPHSPSHSLSLSLSFTPFVLATEEGRTWRAVPNEDQRRAARTSECPPTSSRTHPSLRRSRLRVANRVTRLYAYASGNGNGIHTSLHLSIYRSSVDNARDTATVRESPLAFAVTRRGAKRKLKTTVQQSNRRIGGRETELHSVRNCGVRLRVSLDYIATVFLSVSPGIISEDPSAETSSLIIGDFTTRNR